ncbi:uncharacterized protein BDZ99DRAFT_469041 [Mytilinidion resinicola]|uniref:Uncharacterized protein n=1 Tax=Mytilinidion resinicola TaxID=574789 RepID=A0A6A6Y2N7_9PEZI|nr:uncharacterized protein BDZ99DRAFT_469041 [Mytilinidion resinicola]KAF2802274.1 hypothetical protein BDZ99DRAFT_469041 [Mytilinidion resinicola]
MSDYDYYSPRPRRPRTPDGFIAKRRSEVRPGEVIVRRAPQEFQDQYSTPPQYSDRQLAPYNDPYNDRQSRSLARRRRRRPQSEDLDRYYDSEGSIPPRARLPQRARSHDDDQNSDQDQRGGQKGGSQRGGSQRGGKNGKGDKKDNDQSSSDLGSTSSDEKHIKAARRKKYLTFGLTGIATIHAAGSIHKAMELAKERKAAVAEGEMSSDEAKKKKKQQRWQELGAVGISALGIYQSVKEVKEARELHGEHRELMEKREERHRKREERRKKGWECRPGIGY